jgi:hypothetical protein
VVKRESRRNDEEEERVTEKEQRQELVEKARTTATLPDSGCPMH